MRIWVLFVVVLAGLSGCGGSSSPAVEPPGTEEPTPPGDGGGDDDDGGSGDGDGGETFDPVLDYAAREAAFEALDSAFRDETGWRRTPQRALPAGQALYEGHARMDLSGAGSAATLNGDMRLLMNFGLETAAGEISNLRRSDDTPLGGALEIRDGTIDGAGDPVMRATLEGTLTGGRGALDVDGTIDGSVYGDNAGFVRGRLSGTVGTRDGVQTLDGGFVTAR
ncbi:hypothetical protein [Tranquillimonas rosea]|uniref:hypothetical protein n=1 Tax=Tranquillimonas rosea TaxID=641238 RepID=UPI003BAA67C3